MKISNILRHIRRYGQTGKISNSLLPYFNQYGKWCEELIPLLPDKVARPRYEIPHDMMRKITLPREQRITGDRASPVLRTSFVTRSDKVVTIPYSEIRGSVVVKGNKSIEAEALKRVGGYISVDTTITVYAPNLLTVAGDLDATRCSVVILTSLRDVGGSVFLLGRVPQNLVVIGGRCIIQRAVSTRDNALRSVGKSLIANDLDKVYFPKLESVGEHMVMLRANRIEARMLREVGGFLLAGQAEIMLMPKLRFVGGDLNTQLAKEFHNPQLTVRGRWMQAPGAKEFWIQRMQVLDVLKGNQEPLFL